MASENMINEFISLRDKLLESQYKNLNQPQRDAVFTVNGPILILAGAGSGKTTVLVNRIANMMRFGDSYKSPNVPEDLSDEDIALMLELLESNKGKSGKIELDARTEKLLKGRVVYPGSMLAITFTNKAAREMRERIERLLGSVTDSMWIGTFHSTCVRILRRDIDKIGFDRSFVIYDTADQLTVIKDCIKELNLNEKNFPPKGMLDAIGKAKDELIDCRVYKKMYESDFRMSKIASIYELYQSKLRRNNAVDFDDIINHTIKLFSEHPDILEFYQKKFRYVMVDEYQDTNTAQYTLVSMISHTNRNLCVVGDDDQSIYGWRGANIRNILDFEKEFKNCKTIKLEQNYRSTQLILDAANNVIKNNSGRKSKSLWTENKEGSKIQYYEGTNEYQEATFVASEIKRLSAIEDVNYKDFAILYRINAQSRILEEMLMREAIPYKIFGGLRFYDRKEIKDILAYLRVIQNPSDNISLKRIINVPKRGIGNTTVDNAEEIANGRGLSIFSAIDAANEIPELKRAAPKLDTFVSLINRFRILKEELSVSKLIEEVIKQSGIMDELKEENTVEATTRIENIQELISGAIEFESRDEEKSLEAYLSQISLVADVDKLEEESNNVVLMTLHSAKGLEFPTVFMVGMEEGIFPGYRAALDETELEEERRLCYVGITRAKKNLFMTSTSSRTLFGNTTYNKASRFMKEIPPQLLEGYGRPEFKSKSTLNSTGLNISNILNGTKVSANSNMSSSMKSSMSSMNSSMNSSMGNKNATGNSGSNTSAFPRMYNPFDTKQGGESSAKSSFNVGDKVAHKKFGEGVITSVEKENGDFKLEIQFKNAGMKRLMAAFANLSKIG